MARRIAINLRQRIGNSTRGNGRGRGVNGRGNRGDRNDNVKSVNLIRHNKDEQHIEVQVQKDTKNDFKDATSGLINHPVDGKSENLIQEEFVKVESTENNVIHNTESSRKRRVSQFEPTETIAKKIKQEDVNEGGNMDEILQIMGFTCFGSTKLQHVGGTDCYGINFKQRTEYRQYMNREGGFNRSLSPTRLDRKKIKLSLKKNK